MGNGTIINEPNEKTKKEKNDEIEKQKSDFEKEIEFRRKISFQPISLVNNNNVDNKVKNPQNIITIKKESIKKQNSSPLKYNKTNNNDENILVLTDYFDKINDKEKEELEKINYKFNHTFYQLNEPKDPEEVLFIKQIKEKINTDFGLKQSIKKDFDKMKTCLLYCSNLTSEEENYISKYELYEHLINNFRNKQKILSIINKNKTQIPELIVNIK